MKDQTDNGEIPTATAPAARRTLRLTRRATPAVTAATTAAAAAAPPVTAPPPNVTPVNAPARTRGASPVAGRTSLVNIKSPALANALQDMQAAMDRLAASPLGAPRLRD